MASAPRPLSFSDIAGAPTPGTFLCHVGDLANAYCVELNYRHGSNVFSGFIFAEGDQVRAYVNACPHTGSPLNLMAGEYFSNDGSELQCRTHDARFNPKNGRCTKGPCRDEWLQQILIVVEGDKVLAA